MGQTLYLLLSDVDTTTPLNMGTLTLLKWKDGQKQRHFRLVDKVSADWKDFGCRFAQDNLKAIEKDRTECRSCWLEVMEKWINETERDALCDYPASWKGVVSVLDDVQKGTAAKDLRRALCSPISPPAPVPPTVWKAPEPAIAKRQNIREPNLYMECIFGWLSKLCC